MGRRRIDDSESDPDYESEDGVVEIEVIEAPTRAKRRRKKPTKRKTNAVRSNRKALSKMPHVPAESYNLPRFIETREDFDLREKKFSLNPTCTWSEFDILPASMEELIKSAEEEGVREFLRTEVEILKMMSAYLDYLEVQNMQLVRFKSSSIIEENKLQERGVLSQVLRDKELNDVTSTEVRNMLGQVDKSCQKLSSWRRDCQAFKVKISQLGPKLEKAFVKKERGREIEFEKVLEWFDADVSGLHKLPVTGQKLWTTVEERRIRAGMLLFGRDHVRATQYANMGRVPKSKAGVAPAIIKSKVQKILLFLRKHALLLPPVVAATGKEYSQKGLGRLDETGDYWKTFWPDINVQLPMDEVPFGRRKWVTPCEPIFENLLDDDEESDMESE